jgi:hypothetical protein
MNRKAAAWIHLFHNYTEKAIDLCHYYDNSGLPTTGKFTGFSFFLLLETSSWSILTTGNPASLLFLSFRIIDVYADEKAYC